MTIEDDARLADAIEAEAWEALFDAMPAPMKRATGARVERVADATLLVAPGLSLAYFNRVIGLGAARAVTADDLDAVAATYARAGAPTWMLHTSHATRATGDLEAQLRAAHFAPLASRPRWAKFLRGPTPPPDAPTTLTVRRIDAGDAEAFAQALVSAHQMPQAMAPWTAAMVGRDGITACGSFDGDALVGGGLLYRRGERAWLGLGGTASSHRGRGGQRAIMARRVEEAIWAGATAIATETGEPIGAEANPSYRNMIWCGFERVASRENWIWGAAAPAAPAGVR